MSAPKPGPTTAPMLTMPSDPAPLEEGGPLATPPEPEDIPDPIVPEEVTQALAARAEIAQAPAPCTFGDHEALLSGFTQALSARMHTFMLDEHKGLMQTLDATLVAMRKWVEAVATHSEHAEYTLGDALTKLQAQGLTVLQNPYTAVVAAISAQGFPVTLTIAKRDAGELVQAIQGLTTWLAEANYAVPEGVRP